MPMQPILLLCALRSPIYRDNSATEPTIRHIGVDFFLKLTSEAGAGCAVMKWQKYNVSLFPSPFDSFFSVFG